MTNERANARAQARSTADAVSATQHENENDRSFISFGGKFVYGLGDVASQLAWSLGTSYLTLFYTDSVGLATGAVAVLLLVARILDAIIDPVIGALSERTRSRFGRFRPWILFGSPILALMLVLTFTSPFGNGTAGFGWAIGTYILLGILYSAVNVPYGSLSMSLSPSTRDRVSLNSFRLIGTNIGNVVLSLVSAPLIIAFSGVGDGKSMTAQGYTLTAVVMGVLSLALFLLLFFRTKEVVTPVRHERVTFTQTARAVVSNRPLMALFISMLFIMLGFFGRLSTIVFYFINNVRQFDLIGLFMMTPALAGIVGIVLFANPRMTRRFGKKKLVIGGAVVSALSLLALYFVDWSNIAMIFVLSSVYGIANFCIAIMMGMIPDTIDDGEVRTGVRSDGTGYAAVSFSQKLGTALGASIGVALLGAFGYVANSHPTGEVLNGINIVGNVFPAICFLLAIVPLMFYKLSEEHVDSNTDTLRTLRIKNDQV